MGRKKRIDPNFASLSEDGVLTIRTAPIFQPLLAPARATNYFGVACDTSL